MIKLWSKDSFVSALESMKRNGRMAHAFLLTGEKGVGKKTAADYIAMTLLCERGGDVPCGECRHCRRILENIHPDVIRPEKSGGAYFKERTQELDRKLMTAQKQLHANLDDQDNERLDELRKLIGIFERAEPIIEFDEIKFGQIVEKITVLSETEIRFDLIGKIGFTERIAR